MCALVVSVGTESAEFEKGVTMLQISIGRNIPTKLFGGVPMSDKVWLQFQQNVEDFLMLHTTQRLADTKANGVSHWNGESEETCLFVWFDTKTLPKVAYEGIRTIAKQYGQEAIAVTFGNTELVGESLS